MSNYQSVGQLRRIAMGGAAALALLSSPHISHAATAAPVYIEAGGLEAALLQLARQTRSQIFFPTDLVRGKTAPALNGRLTADQGLDRLLAGSGLSYERQADGVRVVVARAVVQGRRAGVDEATSAPEALVADRPHEVDEIVVTGSLIRGVKDGASPVVVIEREAMDRAGHATVAEAMRGLPQNFAGLASEESFVLGTDRSGKNASHASGVNLRGLGPDATLVLINGRRLAGVGGSGDFADLSTIPAAAVERVEVLLDGASALYGSDAVGGVVNIILRQAFEGAETRLRVGQAEGGGARELLAAQTLGRTWSSGSLLVSYEYYDRGRLGVEERAATASADLRRLGGSDWRRPYATPGNILGLDAGGYRPLFAIPALAPGQILRPGDFLPGQTNLDDYRLGSDLLPDMRRHAVYSVIRQNLHRDVELVIDARLGDRRYDRLTEAPFAIATVGAANPYFVSPTGAASHTVGYSFRRELGPSEASGEIKSLGLTTGLNIDLPFDWRVEAYGAVAREKADTHLRGAINSAFLSEALGATPDNPATPFSATRDGFFNLFGSGTSNTAGVLAFVGSGYSDNTYKSEVSSVNLKADGPVVDLPAGPIRLAVGAQRRWEALKTVGVTALISLPRPTSGVDLERRTDALFAEVSVPLFSNENALPLLRRLEVSAAVRREDYSDAGLATSPKVGVVWSPAASLVMRASYGESFRAPGLREAGDRAAIGQVLRNRNGVQVLALQFTGGNPDLAPQTASSTTFGVEYRPAWAPRLELTADAFSIAFNGRIGAPVSETPASALTDPNLAPFVELISPATNAADLARVKTLLASPNFNLQAVFPPEAYGAIIDARNVNAARIEVEGVDLAARYAFARGSDMFSVSAEATHIHRYRRRITSAAPFVELSDTLGYPVDWRGRAQVSWSRGDIGAGLTANYVDGYASETAKRISSWTTIDAQLRFQPSRGVLRSTSLAFTVRNVLNEQPPFYDSPFGVAYDPGQSDVMGRQISILLTRTW